MTRLFFYPITQALLVLVAAFSLNACQRPPPAERPAVTLAEYTSGDADNGKTLYQDACEKCHRLQAGSNEKGPQLMRIYGAKAGLLSDYQYTEALKNSQKTWTADELDQYIAHPKQTIPGTRMRSEPINKPSDRKDIIAYLSTLR